MRAILFVCTGNTCRSPAAAALFSARLAACGQDPGAWWVESAGLRAGRGQVAAPEVQAALAKRGIDLSRKRSQPLKDVPIAAFDLILTMEAGQKNDLQERYPVCSQHTYLLAEMCDALEEVPDPFGEGEAAYRSMLAQLDRLFEGGMAKIISLSGGQTR